MQQKIERINKRIIDGRMSEEQGDQMIDEVKKELKELRMKMLKWDREESYIGINMNNLKDSYKDYSTMDDDELKDEVKAKVDNIWVKQIKNGRKYVYEVRVIMKDGLEYDWQLYKERKEVEISHNGITYDIKRSKRYFPKH